jgi:hypothetical protein
VSSTINIHTFLGLFLVGTNVKKSLSRTRKSSFLKKFLADEEKIKGQHLVLALYGCRKLTIICTFGPLV